MGTEIYCQGELDMIRLSKPVKLLEWGEGTTTLNQVWREIAKGRIASSKQKDGLTTLVIEVEGPLDRKNLSDPAIKVVQQGEGMCACSEDWGEVAFGEFKSADLKKHLVTLEVKVAAKLSKFRG